MKKIIVLYFLIALLSIGIVYGNSEHNLEEAKQLIDAKIPCSQLTEGQLEHIGDYLIEQMHPGEAHEVMDEMMGGEGSESLRQMHIAMAKRLYCNDISGMINYGMMGMMSDRGVMPYSYGHGFYGIFNFLFWILLIVAIIFFIVWLFKNMKKDPLQILKGRYAKGEISKKQFDEMKKELR